MNLVSLLRTCAIAALLASASIFAQSGDFAASGKVVNASGAAIPMATVTYCNPANRLMFDFSRTDGTFGTTVSVTQPQQTRVGEVYLPTSGSVTIDMFDMNGKKVSSISKANIEKGNYVLDPGRVSLANGMYMLKITSGNSVSFQKLLYSGNVMRASGAASASGSDIGLSKSAAGIVDTVRVGKTGYTPVKVPVTSLASAVGTVTLQTIDIETEVTNMFNSLSQAEVVGQCAMPVNSSTSPSSAASNVVGSSFGGGGAFSSYTPSSCATWCNSMQAGMQGTSHKIPLLISYDGVHGMDVMPGGSILPHNMGMGAIQDSTIFEKAFRVAGLEIRGTGSNWTFGPCIAVIRDDRWGRSYEGFAETPELTSKCIRWALLGEQTSDLSHPWAIAATCKHFAGDGGTINGVNPGQTAGTDATARALHLPGYTSAVQTGVAAIMPSFSQWVDGTYMHCNSALLTDWLKTQQNFTGFLVGDWEAHGVCGGASQSMAAGLDVPMAPSAGAGVNALIPFNARTQDACKRVLRVKYKMDLFHQYNADNRITSQVGSAMHRDAVRAAVRASLVLLKNTNTALPIPKTASVAIWGQGGNDVGIQCGGWTTDWQGSTGNPTPGTSIYQGVQTLCSSVTYSSNASSSGSATYVIAVLSEDPYAEKSFPNISLTADMATSTNSAVINALAGARSAGKKVIVILMAGRPLDVSPFINNCDAFVWASLPGTEGLGIGQVLFNDQGYHFSGKLPVSIPSSASNYEPANGGALYSAGTGINPY